MRDLTSHLLPGGATAHQTTPHHTALGSSVVCWTRDWADDADGGGEIAATMEQQHNQHQSASNNDVSEESEGDRNREKAKPPQSQRSVAFDLSSPGEDKQEEKTRRVTIR